jgi:hypothetical protein
VFEWIAIGIAAGVAVLLEGCSSHKRIDLESEDTDEEIESATERDITIDIKTNTVTENQKWIVEGACVICTNAKIEGTSSSKMIMLNRNEYTQGKSELCHTDVIFEPLFEACESQGICQCMIEGNQWQNYDESKNIAGKYGMLKDEAYMVCTYGYGLIYATDDGQIVNKMEYQGAIYVMQKWLNGEIESNQILQSALNDAARYGEQTQVPRMGGGFVDNGQYDASILAWTNYWNDRLEDTCGKNGYTPIRTVVVKAFIAQESSFGTYKQHNGTHDIMQSMVPGDPCFWSATGKDPTQPGKSHFGETEQVITITDLSGAIDYASLYKKCPSNAEMDWFNNGTWSILNEVLKEDSNGEYHYYYDNVTQDMSLAIGIGWYSYKLNMERGKLSERKGVENYNGGGDSEYMEKFNEKMGYINDVLYD